MITRLRLTWHLQGPEIFFVAVACLAVSAAAFWLTVDMRSMLTGCGTPAAAEACQLTYPFQEAHGQQVMLVQIVAGFVPFVAGLLLGVPLVAREIEQRSALISWPLAASRPRWLAWRLAPVLVLCLGVIGVLALATDQMWHAYFPNSDLGFAEYESRGVPLVMRSLLMLAAGVAIGAIVGRFLPGLLIGIGVGVAVAAGLAWALPNWVPATELTVAESAYSGPGQLTTEVRYRMPDGRVVDAQTGEAAMQAAYEAHPGAEPDPSTLPQPITYGIAASRYPEVVLRESAALGSLAIGLVGLAAVTVNRRRPE